MKIKKDMLLLFLINFMTILNACEKFKSLDDELILNKTSYTSDQLRIDGYYYTQIRDIYIIYFLYRDGILASGGHVFENELNEYEEMYRDGSFWNVKKDKKLYWGLFNIDSDKIMIEKWYPSSGGGMPAYLHSGEILNDTTFIITKSIRSKTGEEKELYETYHFKQFSPKPDSTNNFIK